MTYAISRRRARPLGALNPLEVIEDRFTRVVKAQSDRILDNVGDRFSLYLDSSSGQKLMDKFGDKVESSFVDAAYKHKWELALAGISVAAMTVVGVSLGAKVGKTGIQIAAGVAVAAALPLVFGGGETEEDRKKREAADRARKKA